MKVLSICFVALASIGLVVSWLVTVINLFKTVANRNEGVPLFPSLLESPFTIIFRPTQLNEKGLLARRRVFLGFASFLGCFALLTACVLLNGWGMPRR